MLLFCWLLRYSQKVPAHFPDVLSHSALVLTAILPEVGRRELPANGHCVPHEDGLAHAQHTPCSVVQGQRVVDHVVVLEAQHDVHGHGHELEPDVVDDGGFGQPGGPGRVDVEHVVLVRDLGHVPRQRGVGGVPDLDAQVDGVRQQLPAVLGLGRGVLGGVRVLEDRDVVQLRPDLLQGRGQLRAHDDGLGLGDGDGVQQRLVPKVVVDEGARGPDLGQPHPHADEVGARLHQQRHGVPLANALGLHEVAHAVAQVVNLSESPGLALEVEGDLLLVLLGDGREDERDGGQPRLLPPPQRPVHLDEPDQGLDVPAERVLQDVEPGVAGARQQPAQEDGEPSLQRQGLAQQQGDGGAHAEHHGHGVPRRLVLLARHLGAFTMRRLLLPPRQTHARAHTHARTHTRWPGSAAAPQPPPPCPPFRWVASPSLAAGGRAWLTGPLKKCFEF